MMKRGLGLGLTMMTMTIFAAACEHQAQRDSTANGVNAAFFESAAPRPASVEPAAAPSREPMPGHTDKFLWDDRAPKGDELGTDAGVGDGGPRATPDDI